MFSGRAQLGLMRLSNRGAAMQVRGPVKRQVTRVQVWRQMGIGGVAQSLGMNDVRTLEQVEQQAEEEVKM